MTVRILVVRHGETEWNVEQRFRGSADIPLNAKGLLQAQALAQRLEREPISAVYTSPLQRAFKTAETIASPHGLVPAPLDGLSNINYGELEGRTIAEVAEHFPEMYRTLLESPQLVRFPCGDTLDEITVRAMSGLNGLIARHDGETIAAVSHQVITKVILCAMLGLDNSHHWSITQDTCCFNVVRYRKGQFIIDHLNDICHLADVD